MALFSQDALNPGVRKREVFGWAMYDFANSGYTTVVLTAVFSAYFVGGVAGGASWATFAWTAALAGAGPGDVAWAVVAIVLSNVFYTYGESLIAAFLPELARQDSLGRVSGWGWSFGYFGGMLTLGSSLGYVLWAQGQGIPAAQFVPVTMLITAGVYGVAALATFALLRERALPQPVPLHDGLREAGLRASLSRLRATWQQARRFRDFSALLACAVAYQAGISVVIALSAVYAEQVMKFEQTQTMALIFLVNIAAALGAFSWGYVQDRIGHRLALGITLAGWIVMIALAAAATGPGLFWVAAVIAGLCMGSSQSAGRALAGLFAPAARRAEFYGFWTFALRLSAIIGPLTYGLVTLLTAGNHRLAIVSTGVFFVLGLALLMAVDVPRGQAAAETADRGAAAR